MKIKLLVATADKEYAKLISDNISEHHSNIIEVNDCSTLECLHETLSKRRFDVALMDTGLIKSIDTGSVDLSLILWSESEASADVPAEFGRIKKYQRISTIVSEVLERYAGISGNKQGLSSKFANITAVWSPTGGVGKTTIALAYAMARISEENEVFYLNLEDFSSVPGYFNETGKSISSVFEMLDNPNGNIKMLIKGICCNENGITYLCNPDNFDDMHILSPENIYDLVTSCAEMTDELIIDLSGAYDARSKKVFELAHKVFIVTEPTISAKVKLAQFATQNNVFETIKEKVTFIANKEAQGIDSFSGQLIRQLTGGPTGQPVGQLTGQPVGQLIGSVISIPFIQTENPKDIYKTLAESFPGSGVKK